MTTLPFKTTTHSGFADVNGLLRHEDDALGMEFEIADAVTGLLKSTIKVEIPMDQIAECEYLGGFIAGKVRIRTKEIALLDGIPWSKGAEFDVSVRRRHRADARNFVEEMSWALQ